MGLELVVLGVRGQQLDPLTGAVKSAVLRQDTGTVDFLLWGVTFHLGHVEGAVVQNGHVVLEVALLVLLGGDELVDVLEARVITGVAHHGAVLGDVDVAGLVLVAAHCGVLNRGGFRIERVDFYEPAEAVRLVRLLGDVEAVIVLLPLTIGRALFDAETLEGLGSLLILDVATSEVLVEVLLAGQHGVPRGHATGAVVEGTEDLLALLVSRSLDKVRALCRTNQGERGGGGDTAVERTELALELTGVAHLGDLEDGVAVASPTNLDLLFGRVLRIVVREHHRLGGVLVGAHVDESVLVIRVLDEASEVIVEAELLLSSLGGLVVDVELRSAFDDRVAPGDKNGLLVALRDNNFILGVRLDLLEVHALSGGQLNFRFLDFGGLASGAAASSRVFLTRSGTRSQGGGAADGDDSQAAGAQSGTTGELVTEVRPSYRPARGQPVRRNRRRRRRAGCLLLSLIHI